MTTNGYNKDETVKADYKSTEDGTTHSKTNEAPMTEREEAKTTVEESKPISQLVHLEITMDKINTAEELLALFKDINLRLGVNITPERLAESELLKRFNND